MIGMSTVSRRILSVTYFFRNIIKTIYNQRKTLYNDKEVYLCK